MTKKAKHAQFWAPPRTEIDCDSAGKAKAVAEFVLRMVTGPGRAPRAGKYGILNVGESTARDPRRSLRRLVEIFACPSQVCTRAISAPLSRALVKVWLKVCTHVYGRTLS